MARTTAYFVQAFETVGKNRLKPLLPIAATSSEHADRIAQRIAQRGGAIAASQSGDPETGDYGEPTLIGVYGDIPDGFLDSIAA